MPKDTRPFITLTDEYPEHPKVVGLSDGAFRAHVEMLCWANRNRSDGAIPAGLLRRYRKPAVKELVASGLLEEAPGGYVIHDYLEHNPSRDEIEERMTDKRERASAGGRKSAHMRWHVGQGVFNPECEFCTAHETG